MKAVVAGGGIGGLCAALALQQRGWEVEVWEQAFQLEEVGAGLQLSPNAVHVLAALDLLKPLREKGFLPQSLEMRLGRSGRSIFSIPLQTRAQLRWGQDYWHIHRADLQEILLEALALRAPHSLRLGCGFVSYEDQGSLVQVQGTERVLSAELLIGADGIHSAVQKQLMGDQAPQFTGNVAWRAVVPMERLRGLEPPPSACVWTGKGRHAVTYRLRGGRLANFVGVVEQSVWKEESWTTRGSREEALADFASFHPVIKNLIQQADEHFRWALFDRAPLPHWSKGAVTLLGDACHPMLPFLAQGAAQAIEDAWVLADCLNPALDASRSVAACLEQYQTLRLPRTRRIQAGARANMRRFHQPAWAYFPLWLAARIQPSIFLRMQDWIYAENVTKST